MADSPEEKDPKGTNQPVDPASFLLPKKESAPSTDSAQRINAGALLEQEQKAAAEGLAGERPRLEGETERPSAAAPTAAAEPKKEETTVRPLQTYQGDVESVVQNQSVSVVSIAAAEAKRRAQAAPPPKQQEEERAVLGHAALIGGGILLLSVAAGLIAYFVTRPTTVPVVELQTSAPFIAVDDTTQVTLQAGATRADAMGALNDARKGVKLSLGLMARLDVASPGATSDGQPTLTEVPIGLLLGTLAPYVPEVLLRTLTGQYMLGVHSYDENDAFLILGVDSYETAYNGMLAWEPSMRQDLSPLFDRVPPVRANDTATTTPAPQVLPTAFSDRVVENHDARVVQNEFGDLLFLWTFIDRNTIVITNNQATLREIITRIKEPALQALPQ